MPVLTLAQLSSNGARVWLNRRELCRPLVGRFAVGAVPFALAGALLLAHAPLAALKRLLGVFLLAAVAWRRRGPRPGRPRQRTFTVVGAASGLGSALLGSVGPLTAPFFLAYGLTRAGYVGTEAAGALTLHLAKTAGYAAGGLLDRQVLLLGAALTPATLLGAAAGRRIVARLDDRVFVLLVEVGLLVAGVLFLLGG